MRPGAFDRSPGVGTFLFSGLIATAIALAVTIGCAPGAGPATAPMGAAPAPAATVPAAPAATVPAAAAFPFTFTDGAGRSVTVPVRPGRIVSLSPGTTEVLFAIGAGSQVVGTDSFSDYPPEAVRLPKVAYSNPDLERIVALNPDLVIVATRQRQIVPELEKLGLRAALRLEPESLAGLYEDIRLLGRLTGQREGAEQLVASMQQRVARIVDSLRDVPAGPRYYWEIDPKLFTVSDRTFIADLVRQVKGVNIFANAERPFPQVSQEAIIAADPEVIFLADGPPTGNESLETLRARPGWGSITAVRTGRVYVIDGNLASRPGPRVVEAIEVMARALYPERVR